MTLRKRTRAATTARKLGELAVAAPQVVAHRVGRMATSGLAPSPRDRKEFAGMVHEKQVAFAQSWMAMFAEGLRVQQSMWLSWVGSLATLPTTSLPALQRRRAMQLQDAAVRIASKGLAPIHRKAVANSKRLAKTKLR